MNFGITKFSTALIESFVILLIVGGVAFVASNAVPALTAIFWLAATMVWLLTLGPVRGSSPEHPAEESPAVIGRRHSTHSL
ncbi:hypothetical protein [Glaciihabitans sp. dw_435]|uniref:hypothetical protein n=1 Tax=Glaciihabitans sp. dw_435 TaxID=2720081 RepID=UPI001BD375AC|nr:hypothetical protein [Glaciihabitans sp. dw_435]